MPTDRETQLAIVNRKLAKASAELARREISTAVTMRGGNEKLLLPGLLANATCDETPTGFSVSVEVDGVRMSVAAAVEKLRTDPATMPAFGLQIANPWSARSRNLTRQMMISRENPELAARLKARAEAERS